jgi:hypothetical protein|tara:strand:+ start:1342 stop:1791 length:450 start_codon:yes stop_codon:yes gene_type:complete
MEDMPITTLSNGIRVANFSSPHDFEFEDSSILKACSKERAEKLKIIFNETIKTQKINAKGYDVKTKTWQSGIDIKNISLDFELSENVLNEMDNIIKLKDLVDIIIIPLPMLTALKKKYTHPKAIEISKYRVIKMKSRTEKLVKINEWCI